MAIRTRRSRRQTTGRFKLKQAPWLDPFPAIEGTEPEKRVFAMLVQMKIYFIYQGQVPEFEKGGKFWQLAPVNYKPDFVLPEYRVIIDPFSPFHHSLDKAVKRDVRKIVAYSVAGYAYYHPWAEGGGTWRWDQYAVKVNPKRNKYRKLDRNLHKVTRFGTYEMLRSIPEIVRGPVYKLTDPRDIKAKHTLGYRIGQYLGAGANSVAAANKARALGGGVGDLHPSAIRYGHRRTIRRS